MDSGFSVLQEAALAMHEMYTEFRRAGFTRDEALKLVVLVSKGDGNG